MRRSPPEWPFGLPDATILKASFVYRRSTSEQKRFDTLGELLQALERKAADTHSMSIAQIQEVAGRRAFGPLLLLPGLLAVTPLSGIPTVPTIIGIIVFLIAIQLAVGRMEIWLPNRIRTASLDADRLQAAMRFLKPAAKVIDKAVHRRLPALTGDLALRISALVCLVVAATMPPLEVLPFTATAAGAIIAVFGLALTVHDGLLIIAAYALIALFAAGGFALIAS